MLEVLMDFFAATGFIWLIASPMIGLGILNLTARTVIFIRGLFRKPPAPYAQGLQWQPRRRVSAALTEADMKALIAIPKHPAMRKHAI